MHVDLRNVRIMPAGITHADRPPRVERNARLVKWASLGLARFKAHRACQPGLGRIKAGGPSPEKPRVLVTEKQTNPVNMSNLATRAATARLNSSTPRRWNTSSGNTKRRDIALQPKFVMENWGSIPRAVSQMKIMDIDCIGFNYEEECQHTVIAELAGRRPIVGGERGAKQITASTETTGRASCPTILCSTGPDRQLRGYAMSSIRVPAMSSKPSGALTSPAWENIPGSKTIARVLVWDTTRDAMEIQDPRETANKNKSLCVISKATVWSIREITGHLASETSEVEAVQGLCCNISASKPTQG
ncbi:hypothetical protein B0H17DRAFT_1146808 [Mycena rosella]|uniref:Uncharacterized protein n=1 Tax=Mycena rosella TaxID=1033263 RepID=A0AAD7G448_MYCRO|nr:hypothetical protein B0H17DRAFT_1146808 [Mycena rosella]